MRRVLVPLDGTDLSTAILDDAVRMAGADGTLILAHEVKRLRGRAAAMYNPTIDTEDARQYLEGVAEGLRARGMSVATVAKSTFHVTEAIESAARDNEVDLIACATHSRGVVGSFLSGSVAWQVLAHSTVPVMLRHATGEHGVNSGAGAPTRILVPLDGSPFAEQALPLALELAAEWDAPLDLVAVIPPLQLETQKPTQVEYLARISAPLAVSVRTHVLVGDPTEELIAFARGADTTHVVMSTHGRGGLSRVLVGSVAYELIRRLALPVILIPAFAARIHESVETREHTDPVHA